MRQICAGLIAVMLATTASAEVCTREDRLAMAEHQERYASLDLLVRRLGSRISSQDARIADLPDDLAGGIPAAAELPRLPDDFFDDRSQPLVGCADGGIPGVTVGMVGEALDATEAKMALAKTATQEREDLIVVAENSLATTAPDDGEDDQIADASPVEDPPVDDAPAEDPAPDLSGDDAVPGDGNDIVAGSEDDTTAAPVVLREPMKDTDNEFLFRRVITLPDNQLVSEVGGSDGEALPVFQVLYVFAENNFGGEPWLEVGVSLQDETMGWIRADQTVAWSTMLVMQFNENPRRGKVLFYESDTHLVDTVQNVTIDQEVEGIYDDIQEERRKLIDDPTYQPAWDDRLVAIEPDSSVRYQDKPYLLPILDFRRDEFPDGTPTTLVEIAAIPAEGRALAQRDEASLGNVADPAATADGQLPIGIVFVLDTTISMGPYIDRTKLFVEEFYEAFDAAGDINNVSFGLYAFRDNMDHDQNVGYVVDPIQELDPTASPASILANLRRVSAATAPTSGFKEDGFAGLWDALKSPSWRDFGGRIVIMITDASSREGDDPRALYRDLTPRLLATEASENNIAIVPVHLITEANDSDKREARLQYIELAQGIDSGASRYTSVDARNNDDTAFSREATLLAEQIVAQVTAINNGDPLSDPVLNDELLEPVPSDGFAPTGKLAAVVGNEIFRAQLESLARNSDDTAPAFLSGWASDRDLLNRSQEALDVRVFLNRNQLSEMAKRLDIIIESYGYGDDDPAAFFNRIQNLAAEFATDPDAVRQDEQLAVKEVLPGFLRNLPYRSEMLKLNYDFWVSMGGGAQGSYIERLKEKQGIYQSIYDSSENWVDFGAQDPALEAYPIKLRDLP